MSSALAMVLMAAMAVPANGPEIVSAEMEQGLDLSGHWEGNSPSSFPQLITKVEVTEGSIRFHREGVTILATPWEVIDEGGGKLRIEWKDREPDLGIYRLNDHHLIICLRDASRRRPTEFRVGGGNRLLILHRIKPHK